MKEELKEMLNQAKENPWVVVTTIGVIGLLSLGLLEFKSENRLTAAKERNMNPPSQSEQCDNDRSTVDLYCYKQVTQVLCDGQNTFFNFDDDVCEVIPNWVYQEPVPAH